MKDSRLYRNVVVLTAIALAAIILPAAAGGAEEPRHASPTAKPMSAGTKPIGAAPVFVNVTRGKDDLHAASMGLALALSAAKAGRQTVVFLNVQAASFAAAALPAEVRFEDFPPIRQLVADLVASGAKVYVCEHCARVCKVETGKLAPGVMMAGHREILEALPPNVVSFSY